MNLLTGVLVSSMTGFFLGGTAVAALLGRRESAVPNWWRPSGQPLTSATEGPLPAGAEEVLAVLRSSAVVVGPADLVVRASPSAFAFGIVTGSNVAHPELLDLARQVRRDGIIRECELELTRGPLSSARMVVRARVAPLNQEFLLLLVEDCTQADRVERVRRDFIVNISHELKTPVGGISLLAEAMLDASDDPEAIRRFATRMQVESQRLVQLVHDIVDLSRLQVADNFQDPVRVIVDGVVQEAVDRCRVLASAKDISIEVSQDPSAVVYGDAGQLMMAVRNLVDNAITYSGDKTQISLHVSRKSGIISIAVTDEGIGIAETEQARVFERFYRVDPARSRTTGGTGLGLAIVKHVCANHGGEVTLWSVPEQGSTFTIRIPEAADLVTDPVTPAHPLRLSSISEEPNS